MRNFRPRNAKFLDSDREVKGYIYIAGAFVNGSKCGGGNQWIDNDPHFWTSPPTWGICRHDFRKCVDKGDYVFFVLPITGSCPQMIFAYMQIGEPTITHIDAYRRTNLRSKRMGNKNPNGNILVDTHGNYNRFDKGVHKAKFSCIKTKYAIGDPYNSRKLDSRKIRALAPTFVSKLATIMGHRTFPNQRPFDIISRKGRRLNSQQVSLLLTWLN